MAEKFVAAQKINNMNMNFNCEGMRTVDWTDLHGFAANLLPSFWNEVDVMVALQKVTDRIKNESLHRTF